MENLYKYFSPIYKYLKNTAIKTLLYMGFLGFKFAFYLSQQPLYQRIYRFLFVKKPRNTNDILVEPLESQHWICKSQINPVATSSSSSSSKLSSKLSFRNRASSSSSSSSFQTFYHSFEMKEQYVMISSVQDVSIPPTLFEKEHPKEGENAPKMLYSYSFPVATENTEKMFRVIRHQPFSIHDIPSSPPLSSASFVDVQYHHPEMKDAIILEIPKEWCCVGNELFSSAFILRMLYYQTLPFTFDMRYSLEIMDNQLNVLKLESHKFILLNEKSYEVIGTCL